MNFHEYYRNKIGVGPAFEEAENSLLPGERNGPADAYRHILGAAELTRRFGEVGVGMILWGRERVSGLLGQPKVEGEMDDNNNDIGIAIGKTTKTYEENREAARKVISESVASGGSGKADIAKWLDPSKWSVDPSKMNWPPDWSKTQPPKKTYRYSGEEHRYPAFRKGRGDLLNLPVEEWSEEDLKTVSRSDAYLEGKHPAHRKAVEKVTAWHQRTYGKGPVRTNAAGRMAAPTPLRQGKGSSGGPVHVRSHSRDGGETGVRAHGRSPPSR